jgi:tetrahydromethanopterin S-methyltransferase subunit E
MGRSSLPIAVAAYVAVAATLVYAIIDLALLAPFEAAAVAAGVAVGKFVGRRRAGPTPRTAG